MQVSNESNKRGALETNSLVDHTLMLIGLDIPERSYGEIKSNFETLLKMCEIIQPNSNISASCFQPK